MSPHAVIDGGSSTIRLLVGEVKNGAVLPVTNLGALKRGWHPSWVLPAVFTTLAAMLRLRPTPGRRGALKARFYSSKGPFGTEALMENRSAGHKGAKGEGRSSAARRSRGTDHQEVEWQYEVPYGLDKVREWLGAHGPGGLVVLRGSFKEFVDTYYDTEDWRLYRAGYALRVRRDDSGSEATMKSPISGVGNLHRWREISEPLKNDEVDALLRAPGPVGVRLRALVGPGEMRRIFEVRTRRQTFGLLHAGQLADPEKMQTGSSTEAIRIGEVALDDSEIPLGEGAVRLTRVEVEADASTATASSKLEGFVKAMEEDLGLRPAMASKYEAGLSATGQNPDDEAEVKDTKKVPRRTAPERGHVDAPG